MADNDFYLIFAPKVYYQDYWEVNEWPENIMRLKAYQYSSKYGATSQIDLKPCREVVPQKFYDGSPKYELTEEYCLDPAQATTQGFTDYADDSVDLRPWIEVEFCLTSYADQVACRDKEKVIEFFQ